MGGQHTLPILHSSLAETKPDENFNKAWLYERKSLDLPGYEKNHFVRVFVNTIVKNKSS